MSAKKSFFILSILSLIFLISIICSIATVAVPVEIEGAIEDEEFLFLSNKLLKL